MISAPSLPGEIDPFWSDAHMPRLEHRILTYQYVLQIQCWSGAVHIRVTKHGAPVAVG